jgi:hypothetical protein
MSKLKWYICRILPNLQKPAVTNHYAVGLAIYQDGLFIFSAVGAA